MSNPRWSEATEELVAREVYAFGISAAEQVLPATEQFPGYDVDDQEVRNACLQGARQFLAALADAGLLVPPTAETRDDWCVGGWNFPLTEGEAKARLSGGRTVKQRTVTTITTPWAEVTS